MPRAARSPADGETPGLSRPITWIAGALAARASPADPRARAPTAPPGSGSANFGGITPMTVIWVPLARIVRADDIGRAAVPIAPQLVPEQHDVSRPGWSSPVLKSAAEERLNAERPECLERELPSLEPFGPAGFQLTGCRGWRHTRRGDRNDVCRAWSTARSWTLIGSRGCPWVAFDEKTETMRSAFGNGRPLNRPPLTTQKTVVLRPMPTPSVRIAPSESVGYRTSIRTPETRSPKSRSMDPPDEGAQADVRGNGDDLVHWRGGARHRMVIGRDVWRRSDW